MLKTAERLNCLLPSLHFVVQATGMTLLATIFVLVLLNIFFTVHFDVHTTGVVVVTGASSGIGEHAVSTLAATSSLTVFAGVRKQVDADRLSSTYPGIRTVFLDVTSQDSIAAAVHLVRNSTGLPIVGLVNNAGVRSDLPVELQTSEADRLTFEVNVLGLLAVTRAFLPALRETGNGARIVNVGSLAGVIASPGSATYGGSKFAVEGVTDALRREVLPFGISVSLLEPGYVQSKMGSKQYDHMEISKDDRSVYREVFDGFYANDRWEAEPENSSPPATTTTPAILDAIHSSTPKTRYPVATAVGVPASFLISVAWLLPDRVMDWVVM